MVKIKVTESYRECLISAIDKFKLNSSRKFDKEVTYLRQAWGVRNPPLTVYWTTGGPGDIALLYHDVAGKQKRVVRFKSNAYHLFPDFTKLFIEEMNREGLEGVEDFWAGKAPDKVDPGVIPQNRVRSVRL